jgi:hypothetical protein
MSAHKIRLKNEDLIRLILQINEQLEANTVEELINALENGPELSLNLLIKTNIKLET